MLEMKKCYKESKRREE